MNSKLYAAPEEYSQHRTRFRLRFWVSVRTRFPQEVTVMCTMGPSTVRGSASNACGCTLRRDRKRPLKCVIDAATPLFSIANDTAAFLQRGCNVETLDTPKHPAPTGYHHHSSPARFKLDAWWGPARIPREAGRCGPTSTCRCPSGCIYSVPTPVTRSPTLLRASAISTPAMWSMGTSKECVVVLNLISPLY